MGKILPEDRERLLLSGPIYTAEGGVHGAPPFPFAPVPAPPRLSSPAFLSCKKRNKLVYYGGVPLPFRAGEIILRKTTSKGECL